MSSADRQLREMFEADPDASLGCTMGTPKRRAPDGGEIAPPTIKTKHSLSASLTTARHLVDQSVFSIHALMQQSGPTPLMPALQSISGALQQALAELGEVEAGVGLAVHVLGGVR